jgi:hypothetical protein
MYEYVRKFMYENIVLTIWRFLLFIQQLEHNCNNALLSCLNNIATISYDVG